MGQDLADRYSGGGHGGLGSPIVPAHDHTRSSAETSSGALTDPHWIDSGWILLLPPAVDPAPALATAAAPATPTGHRCAGYDTNYDRRYPRIH